MFETIQNLILFFAWPILVIFCLIIFVKGLNVYRLVQNSLVGKVTKALVYTILVDISSLGIITALYIISQPENTNIVLAVFVVWLIIFIWSLKTLGSAKKELRKVADSNPKS